MAYKYLNRSAVLEHLQEGQTVNIDEYIEKLRFFKKYTGNQGTYITDRRYIEYSEIGLHYYKFDTLIKFFENFKHENGTKKALITFSKNHCLQFLHGRCYILRRSKSNRIEHRRG